MSVGFVALLFAAVVIRGTSARLLWGPIIILVSTLPLYSYFFVGPNLASSRYIYFASVGWSFLVSELLVSVLQGRVALMGIGLALAIISVVSLQLNLRPWRIAGDYVSAMETGLERGESASSITAAWTTRTGVILDLENGIPREYQGVWIFLNGYPEFVDRAQMFR